MVDDTRPPVGVTPLSVGAEDVVVNLDCLIREYYRAVYRYAFRLCGSEADAEDLTQQTFLVAQDKLHQVREASKVDRWLFAVLRSCFLKSRRRPRPIAVANLELDVDDVPEHRITEQQLVDQRLDGDELQAALGELPDEFRIVVLMFYFEDLSYQEIATRLELPIGTVMSRLSRAKGRLRHRLFADEEKPTGSDVRRVTLGS